MRFLSRYLHVEKRVIHRDLKPANIFVRRDGNRDGRPALVVGDVGLAKELKNTMAKASVAGTPMSVISRLGSQNRTTHSLHFAVLNAVNTGC